MPVHYSKDSAGPSTRRALVGAVESPLYFDYSDWTKGELQKEASERGLSTSGTKAELIARLHGDE